MAAATPDISALTSSEQIFTTSTLPQIRAIHKALHVQIDDRSARLRTQVGNSYRELLGTADTIVTMRQEMRDAQEILGGMGAQCGRAVVGAKVRSLGRFRQREDEGSELGDVARCRLLEACGLTVNRLMKTTAAEAAVAATAKADTGSNMARSKGERLVLAAKVLVLGRLLISSFGNKLDGNPVRGDVRDAVEAARKTLASLRRRLLKSIDRLMEKVGTTTSRAEILNAMCAYSLASSSGAKDVMFHFLNVRTKVLAFEYNLGEHDAPKGSENVLRGLDLYTGTLLDVQALIPNKLSEALAAIKRSPLLSDDSLKSLETLRLDIYERWCGEDIHHFTPFIQHNDLEDSQAREMLHTWAGKGAEMLLSGTKANLDYTSEFKSIVNLRTQVLQHWIKNGGKAKSFDPSMVLSGLREVINGRLLALLDTKVSKLRLVGSEVSATLESWVTGQTDRQPGLWSSGLVDVDASEHASHLTHAVISRLHGRNEAVSRAVTSYQSWFQLVDDVKELVEHLKSQRWDNDVDEIEDEEVIEERQKMLSKEDPQALHKQLESSLREGFRKLDEHLSAQWQAQRDSDRSGHVAMYLLRILRDIRGSLPKIDGLEDFGLSNVSELHGELACCVAGSPVEQFAAATLPKRRLIGRALWEGSPTTLPVNPSPGIFKLLRDLMKVMGDAGLDLWTPTAVQTLKIMFREQLIKAWRDELASFKTIAVPVESEGVGATKKEASEGGDQAEEEEAQTSPDTTPQKEATNDTEDTTETATASSSDSQDAILAASKPEEELSKDLLIQWVYDIEYLDQSLRVDATGPPVGTSDSSSLAKLAEDVAARAALGTEEQARLRRSSQEYWKRSSLLFGLLA
ncbi:conserved oligomeric Golgi complex subunit 1 [Microdochium nivale]|nr:conserved oligomeric Golgi complex subunit 1 [Microdochium nivale]